MTAQPRLKTTRVPLDSLNLWEGNANRGVVSKIKESMRVNGVFHPLHVQTSTQDIIIGNHRYMALCELHAEHPEDERWGPDVDVILHDVNRKRALKMHLADNKTGQDATTDEEALMAQLQEVMEDDSLEGTGYDDDDLQDILDTLDESTTGGGDGDAEDADAQDVVVLDSTISNTGDVWELGPHRLICGDSTKEATFATLMGEDRADVIWTDPPYGVDYVGGDTTKSQKERLGAGGKVVQNDGAAGLEALLTAAFPLAAAYSRPGAAVYVAHADTARVTFETAIRGAGILVRQNLIWVKNRLVPGRSDYHYRHEPILYGFVPAPAGSGRLGRGGDRWFGDDAQNTVLEFDRPGRNKDHPTMKPVVLVQAMLTNSLRPGGIVLDFFAGSGSTLLAAHYHGGVGRMIELDPRYVDVICRRYQELTGTLPTRNGVEHDFLAA